MAKKKILIIDDSEILCQTMQAKIEENGDFEVRIETKPSIAISATKQYNPDLIILDILMPELDGVSLAIHLYNDLTTKSIPVLFLTALARVEDLEQGDMFGGYQVLSKNVSTDKLIEAVQKNINKER